MVIPDNFWLSMRHFETEENKKGIYIGQQAYPICNTDINTNGHLETLDKCSVFASTLLRSKQTVDYITSTFDNVQFNVIYTDALIERGLGDFEGKSKNLARQNKSFFIDDKFIVELTPPNGEGFVFFRNRVSLILEQIRKQHQNSHILIISHLQVLRMIRFCMDNNFNYSQWHSINYSHGEVIKEHYGKK